MSPNNNNQGFSLLELLLAIAIFSVASIVAGYMIITANINTRLNQQRDEANQIAREGIEAVTSIADGGFSSLNVSGNQGLATSSVTGAWQFSGTSDTSSDGFKRVIGITYSAATSLMATSATVVSTVTWTGANTVSDSASLTTFLTDWRDN